jgi:cytochrome c oxidase assembly protein subunit 15
MENKSHSIFVKFTKWTAILTIFVVFAGSMVKVTGSGMGCPDWPKCFGYYVPPFTSDKITWKSDYEYEKNQMIIQDGDLLVAPGDIQTNESFNRSNWKLFDEHDYNEYQPIHTIIESVNRWASVILGFVVFGMLVFSLKTTMFKGFNILLSFTAFFLIAFEAWLGKLVVEGVLNPTDISYHMLAAFVIVIVVSSVHSRNSISKSIDYPSLYKKVQIGAFLYLLVQLVLGVVLRQTFDAYADVARDTWVDQASLTFYIHRSSSLIYVLFTFITWRIIKDLSKDTFEWKNFKWILIITVLEILSGAIMGYLDVPKFAQPLHVILSSILLCVQSNLFFRIFLIRDLK